MRVMGTYGNDATVSELIQLRTDVNAIEGNLQRLEQKATDWEANQRWQLNELRKELKHIGYMANWCAFAAAVYVVFEVLRRWG